MRLMLRPTDKLKRSKTRARSDSGMQMELNLSTVVRTGLTPKSRRSKPKTKQSSKRGKRSLSSRVCSAKRTEAECLALRVRKRRPNPTPRPTSLTKVREILSAPSSLTSAAKNL